MLTVYSEKHRLRDARTELHGGTFVRPFECPERAEIVLARVKQEGLGEVIAPKDFGLAPVLKVHDPDFVRFLESCWDDWVAAGGEGEALPNIWPTRTMTGKRIPNHIDGKLGYYALAAETSISEGTWEAAKAGADVVLTAVEHLLQGGTLDGGGPADRGGRAAFALSRPPGHHAARDQYGGYCFLNNAAIAAQFARDNGVERVAVLDVDFHHGNGTQNIFYRRDDVFFASLHGDPMEAFPHFLGHADETGEHAGEGFNLNFPLPPGTDYHRWRDALDEALERIAAFRPGLLVVSLGVDTFEEDPISFFKLKSDDFADYGTRIGTAMKASDMPVLFVMEGGYAVSEIGINTVNALSGFEGA